MSRGLKFDRGGGSSVHALGFGIGNTIRDEVTKIRNTGPVTSFKDMSPEKRAEMERLYGNRKSCDPR